MSDRPKRLWKAFLVGLASPVALFSIPASYTSAMRDYSPEYSFRQVGTLLTQALRKSQADEET